MPLTPFGAVGRGATEGIVGSAWTLIPILSVGCCDGVVSYPAYRGKEINDSKKCSKCGRLGGRA